MQKSGQNNDNTKTLGLGKGKQYSEEFNKGQ